MANGDDGSIAKGAIEGVAKTAEVLTDVLDGLRGTAEALAQPFDDAAKATEGFMKSLGATGGFVGFKDLALQLDTLQASLQRATGQGEKFTTMAMGVSSELGNLGVTTQEASEAATSLLSSFTSFTLLAPKTQRELVKQATAMTRLGISTQTTAQNQEILIKAMGMTAEQALATNKDIATLALEIGEAPAKLAQDFTQASPKLAKYGKSGVKVFKQLAAQSKATGIQMGKLLAMTERFDTFEGAAQAAGQLNAMLGGPLLNSVQLLTANEAERVDMIRNAVNATGRSFESMNRFEKQAIAQAAGIGDVADAVRLFGTEQAALDELEEKVDPSIKAQQELTKAMNKGVEIAQLFSAAFEDLSKVVAEELRPVFRDIAEFMTGKKGLGGARSIFRSFAAGLKKTLKFLKQFSGPAQQIGGLAIKVGAFGFAFKQAQTLIEPVMSLLSNKFVLIGAGIMAAYENWDTITQAFSNGAEGLIKMFANLDDRIMGLFAEYEDRFPLLKTFKGLYREIADKIPDAIRFLKQQYDRFLAPIIDDFRQNKGFFEGGLTATFERNFEKVKDVFMQVKSTIIKVANVIGTLIDVMDAAISTARSFGFFGGDEEIEVRPLSASEVNAPPPPRRVPQAPLTRTETQQALMMSGGANMSTPIVLNNNLTLDGEVIATSTENIISDRRGTNDLANSYLPAGGA